MRSPVAGSAVRVWSLALWLAAGGCVLSPDRRMDAEPVRVERLDVRLETDVGVPPVVLVAVHGWSGSPAGPEAVWRTYPLPAHLRFPAGPTPVGDGFSWFAPKAHSQNPRDLATAMVDAADRVAATIRAELSRLQAAGLEADAPVVLTGFSQGGMISFAVALRHPDLVSLVVPVSGWIPQPLWPQVCPDGAPPIRALHGGEDSVVPVGPTRALVAALGAAGCDATLLVDPVAGHQFSAALRRYARQAVISHQLERRRAVVRDPEPAP